MVFRRNRVRWPTGSDLHLLSEVLDLAADLRPELGTGPVPKAVIADTHS